MFDITVSGPGGTSPTDPTITGPLITSPTTGGPLDTISTSDVGLGNVGLTPAGDISLKAYQGLMISTATNFQEMLQQISADNATRASQIYENALLTVQNLLKVEAEINQIVAQEQTLYQQEQTDTNNYNSSVTTYNSTTNTNTNDQAQITTMNNAITAWNTANTTYNTTKATLDSQLSKGTITQSQYNTQLAAAASTLSTAKTTYNTAVSTYNTYNTNRTSSNSTALTNLNTAKTTYKSQVDNVENPQIATINVELIQVGGSTLPSNSNTTPAAPTIPALPTPPADTPVPTTTLSYTQPAPVASLSAPTAPPSLSALTAQVMSELQVASAAIAALQQILQVYSNYNDYIQFILQGGKVSVNPNSFISRLNSVNKDSSVTVGTGAGVSLGLISTSLPNALATRGLSTAINNENYSDIINIPPSTATLIQFLLSELHTQSGLSAGTGALNILGSQLATTEPGSPLAQLAIALAHANQNSALVSSDQLKELLIPLLTSANPGASAAHVADASGQLAAQLKLNLLLSSLISQSNALNFPQLAGAVVGLVNTPAAEAALLSSRTNTLNDVLSDFLSKSAIENNLVATSNGEVSQLQAQNVINDIANQVQQGNISGQAALNSSIQSSLIQQGVSESDAGALAARTSDYINAEINGSIALNASIESSQLSQQNLAAQLEQQGIQASIAQQATAAALATPDLQTQRDLRDSLAKQLSLAQGQNQTNLAAFIAANTAIEAQTSKETEIAQQKSEDDLRVAIYDHAIAQGATPGIADQLVVSILGNTQEKNPISLLNQVKEQVVALKAANKEQEVEAFRNLIRPSFDIYYQSVRTIDPAITVFHNAQTSIQMGSLQMPSNFKKELDFFA